MKPGRAPDDVEALDQHINEVIECLINLTGSKRAAKRRIDAHRGAVKRVGGRPRGSRYPDTWLLLSAALLGQKYRLQGRPVPSRSALIAETVEEFKRGGVPLKNMGNSEDAVVARLAGVDLDLSGDPRLSVVARLAGLEPFDPDPRVWAKVVLGWAKVALGSHRLVDAEGGRLMIAENDKRGSS